MERDNEANELMKQLVRRLCKTNELHEWDEMIDASFPLVVEGDQLPADPRARFRFVYEQAIDSGANEVQAIGVAVEAVQPSEDDPDDDDGDGIDESVYEVAEHRHETEHPHAGPMQGATRRIVEAAVLRDRELRDNDDWIYVYKTGINISGGLNRDTARRVIEEQARVIEELRGKPSTPSPASQQNDTPGVVADEELWAAYRSVSGTDHIISALRAVAVAQRERDRVRVSINEIRECLGGIYNSGLLHLLRERGVEVED